MNRSILYALIFSAAFLALTAALGYARSLGYLSEETVSRAVQVIIGLGLAAYSNFTPKQIGAPGSPQTEMWKQRLLRVTGWSMALAGLTYAGLWAFAPLDFANIASVVVVASAMIICLGYTFRVVAACRKIAAQ